MGSRAKRDASLAQIAQIQRAALRVAKLRGKSKHTHALVLADMMEVADYPKMTPGGWREEVPTGRTSFSQPWIVYALDVWGNADDGFEVNDRSRVGAFRLPLREALFGVTKYRDTFLGKSPGMASLASLYVRQELDGDRLFRNFKSEYLKPHVKADQVSFDYVDDGFIEVHSTEDGEPLYSIVRSNR